MKIRSLVLGLIGLIILIPVIAIVVVSIVGLNRFKPMIESAAQSALGRGLEIAGNIDLALSLRPNITVADVRLANADWAREPMMAEIGRMELQAAIPPLLRGEIVIDRVVLADARVFLEQTADGRANWQFARPGEAPTASDESASSGTGGEAGAPTVPLVRLARIENAVITLDLADQPRREFALEHLDLGADTPEAPLVIEGAGSIDSASFRTEGSIAPFGALKSGAPMTVDLMLTLAGIDLTLDGGIEGGLAAPVLDMAVTLSAADLDEVAALVPPATADLSALESISMVRVETRARGPATALALDELKAVLEASGLTLDASGGVTSLPDAPAITLHLEARTEDLAAVGSAFEVEGLPPGPLRFSASLDADPTRARLEAIDLAMPLADAGGALAVDLTGARPKIEGEIDVARLDLNALEGGATSRGSQSTGSAGQGGGDRLISDEPFDVGALRGLDASLGLTVHSMQGITDQPVSLGLRLEGEAGAWRIADIALEAMGTRAGGAIALDASVDPPAVSIDLGSEGVKLAPILASLGYGGSIEADAILDIALEGQGNSPAAIAASLDGHAVATVGEGRIRAEILEDAVGRIKEFTSTVFQVSNGWVAINCVAVETPVVGGIVDLRTVLMDTRISTVFASGTIDLGSERLDMRVTPQAHAAGVKLSIPMKVGGSLANPSFGLDTAAAVEGAALGLLTGGGVLGAAVTAFSDVGAGDNPCVKLASRPAGGSSGPVGNLPSRDALKGGRKALEDAGRSLLEGVLGR